MCHGGLAVCSDFMFLQLIQMLQKLTLCAKNSCSYVRVFFSLWLKQKSGTGIKPSKTRKIKPVPVSLRQRNLAGFLADVKLQQMIFSDSHVQQNKKETTCCTVRRQIHSGVFQICESKVMKERIEICGGFMCLLYLAVDFLP